MQSIVEMLGASCRAVETECILQVLVPQSFNCAMMIQVARMDEMSDSDVDGNAMRFSLS